MNTQLDIIDSEWCDRMCPVVLSKMRRRRQFTADDLHKHLEPPHNKNLIGSLVAKMSCAKLIKLIGFRASTRPARNGGVVRIWRLK